MLVPSAVDLIGHTPLLALDRVWRGPGRIVAKAEFLLPGASVKDRAAKAIIEAARRSGRLRPGAPVVEMTSGNMGAGLAVVCAALGHPLILTMSAGNSVQRVRMLEALGADVRLVPQVDGGPGEVTGADVAAAARLAENIAAEIGGYYVNQFYASEPLEAHSAGTGLEIWEQTDGAVAAWVACVGTGATFLGVAAALRSKKPSLVSVAVEPKGCEPLAGRPVTKPRHIIQGTGYGTAPPHWDASLMDFTIAVSDDEAADWKVRLAKQEGLHVGYSAAANVCAAARLLETGMVPADAMVATVLCDSGLKY
jgi:cysteine synthase A